jgi:hypothetical protein
MQQQVQPAEFLPDCLEDRRNFLVSGNITGQYKSVCAKSARKFLDVFFETFALVCKDKSCTRLVPGLRDGPRDGPLIGHAKHNSQFPGK